MSFNTRYSKNKPAAVSNFVRLPLLLILLIGLSACGGNKQDTAVEASPQVASKDITAPPQTIVGREEVKERNPEETISFDEWRKRRLEELNKQQNP